MAKKFRAVGGSSFLHGFARAPAETAKGTVPSTWWGSANIMLSEGVMQTVVRLQAQDGVHSRAILYRRGGGKIAVITTHPQADFSSHYLTPALLAAGYAVLGAQTRNLGNDSNCIHEALLADVAAQVHYLRSSGFEQVVLLGNSGGGSLLTFYQAQAEQAPPHRLTTTPDGEPFELNDLDMPQADALILLAAHLGEGVFGMDSLDPSLTDEDDPLSCDPSLDMFNPENGYRQPPESSSYSQEFLDRYRTAQRARCARLDAIAHADIASRRLYREQMELPGFAELPVRERLDMSRKANVSKYMTIARMEANPAFTDLSLHPSLRPVGSLRGPDPHIVNYQLQGFASVMTPEGWLSTWSGLSSRAAVLENIRHVSKPLLVVSYLADAGIYPDQARAVVAVAASADKALLEFEAGHYGHGLNGAPEQTIAQVGAAVVAWLQDRFPV